MTINAGQILSVVTFGTFFVGETVQGPLVPIDGLDVSPAVLLRGVVLEQSLLTAPPGTWPCYIASMPEEPDDCACVYDTEGVKDGRLMIGPVVQHYGVQLKIRSEDYQEGWNKIDEIAASLDVLLNYEIAIDTDSFLIYNITRTTAIVPLGNEPDTKRRFEFTVNFLMTVNQVL